MISSHVTEVSNLVLTVLIGSGSLVDKSVSQIMLPFKWKLQISNLEHFIYKVCTSVLTNSYFQIVQKHSGFQRGIVTLPY